MKNVAIFGTSNTNNMSKFKTGDKVRKNSDRSRIGTVQRNIGNGFYSVEFPSGKIRNYHEKSLIQVNKPKPLPPKQDRSELYKLLPSTKEWGDDYKWIAFDENGNLFKHKIQPIMNDIKWGWISHTHANVQGFYLPLSISWRDTLVSREEMEAWELLQKFEAAKHDHESYEIDWSQLRHNASHHVFEESGQGWQLIDGNFNTTIIIMDDSWAHDGTGYWVKSTLTLPEGADWKKSLCVNLNRIKTDLTNDKATPTETPQAKVERLKAELKQAEAELKKLEPLEVLKYESVFQNNISSPPNLQNKCLMFKTELTRMEQHQWQFSGVDYTILTFYRK